MMKYLLIATLLLAFAFPLAAQDRDKEDEAKRRPEVLRTIVHAIATVIESTGVLVILISIIVSSGRFLHHLYVAASRHKAIGEYRRNLGHGILVGLELLVAADIIGTVALDPTFASIGVLGLIVVVRTFLSFALEIELKGHPPWKDSEFEMRGKPDKLER